MIDEYESEPSEAVKRRERKTILLLIAIALLGLLAIVLVNRSEAGEVRLTCPAPTKNTDNTPLTDLAGINWLYGTAPDKLLPLVTTPGCSHIAKNLTPGMWYFAAKAVNAGGNQSAQSNIASKTIAADPPPPADKTLKTVGGEVYSIGSFDVTAWLVRKYKLYGTIKPDVACDAARPAKDGYWRVPGAQVAWTSTRAKTANPIARCELR